MLFNGNVIVEGDLILGSATDTRALLDNTGISGGDKSFTFPNQSGEITTNDATQTLTNKTLTSPVINTGISGSAILDDDTMATASATTLATSESIKAYVDAQVTGGTSAISSTSADSFEINDDVLMCLLDNFEEHPESKEVRKALIMDLLLPTPTDKDYRAMRKSTFIEIMEKFSKLQEDQNTEIKKKLS